MWAGYCYFSCVTDDEARPREVKELGKAVTKLVSRRVSICMEPAGYLPYWVHCTISLS